MKTSIFTTLFILLGLISCKKDGETNSVLYSTWQATSFMSIESVAYPKNENNKILLTFSKSGNYSLKLDINSCGGSFSLGENKEIDIEFPACTEACCDSKFSEKLATMLPQVTSYEISGSVLKLNVPQWGWIECELIE